MATVKGAVSSSITYATGGSVSDALKAGARSGALAYSNAKVAGYIGDVKAANVAEKGLLHGARGAFFAKAGGADVRSGFVGGMTEGMLGGYIEKHAEELYQKQQEGNLQMGRRPPRWATYLIRWALILLIPAKLLLRLKMHGLNK
jgi:hypothetical protein